MRFTNWLYAWHAPNKGRTPQPIKSVPFQAIMTMKLKDRVSGKSDKAKEGDCLFELTTVLACLAENEHENKLCKKETDKFNDCYKKYLNDSWHAKRAREQGILVAGEKNFTHQQLQKLFKMYPNK